jgi:hypothetical protein
MSILESWFTPKTRTRKRRELQSLRRSETQCSVYNKSAGTMQSQQKNRPNEGAVEMCRQTR